MTKEQKRIQRNAISVAEKWFNEAPIGVHSEPLRAALTELYEAVRGGREAAVSRAIQEFEGFVSEAMRSALQNSSDSTQNQL